MNQKRESFLDQVRRAVAESGLPHNKLSQMAAMDPAAMCRFMSRERGIGGKALDRLAAVLGLYVAQKTPHVAPQGTLARQGDSGVGRSGRRGGKAARATKGRA